VVLRHEATNSGNGTVLPKAHDLAPILHAVVFESLEWDSLVDALVLLGLSVDLLLPLLSAATKTEDEVEGRLLLDIVVRKSAAVLELLASEDKALLIRGDALLVLDLGFHIVDGVRRLNIKRDGLACRRKQHDREGKASRDASQTSDVTSRQKEKKRVGARWRPQRKFITWAVSSVGPIRVVSSFYVVKGKENCTGERRKKGSAHHMQAFYSFSDNLPVRVLTKICMVTDVRSSVGRLRV